MKQTTLLILMLGGVVALAGCVSGVPPKEGYVRADGEISQPEDPYKSCVKSCNADYARCGDSDSSRRTIDSTQGLFGGGAVCKNALSACMIRCAEFK